MKHLHEKGLKGRNKTELAYHQLEDLLLRNRFRPKEMLSPATLSEQLQVSQTPVREALQRLAAEGLLASEPNQGFYVKPYSADELASLFEVAKTLLLHALSRDRTEEKIITGGSPSAQRWADDSNPQEAASLLETLFLDLAKLASNPALANIVANLNRRTHVTRCIAFASRDFNRSMRQAVEAMTASASMGNLRTVKAILVSEARQNLQRLPALAKEANSIALAAPYP